MQKIIKPAVVFFIIWIILTITQFSFRVPATKEISFGQDGKVLSETVARVPKFFDTLFLKMTNAFYLTLSLVALYLFILLIIDAFWERKKV